MRAVSFSIKMNPYESKPASGRGQPVKRLCSVEMRIVSRTSKDGSF